VAALRAFRRLSPRAFASSEDPLLAYLGVLLPELGPPPGPCDRATLATALRGAVEEIAATCPGAAVFRDDLRWADSATLDLVPMLAEWLDETPRARPWPPATCRNVIDDESATPFARLVASGELGLLYALQARSRAPRSVLNESLAGARRYEYIAAQFESAWGLALVAELDVRSAAALDRCRFFLERWQASEDRHYAIPALRWASALAHITASAPYDEAHSAVPTRSPSAPSWTTIRIRPCATSRARSIYSCNWSCHTNGR
jgi:hypothetical protein